MYVKGLENYNKKLEEALLKQNNEKIRKTTITDDKGNIYTIVSKPIEITTQEHIDNLNQIIIKLQQELSNKEYIINVIRNELLKQDKQIEELNKTIIMQNLTINKLQEQLQAPKTTITCN